MTPSSVELAIGTAQFGTAYGIAGRGEAVPHREARRILDAAWHFGVRAIDTAPSYGDIEDRLTGITGGHPFSIISKIPALLEDGDGDSIANFVTDSIRRSRNRLGDRLSTILFHRGEDLLGRYGVEAIKAAQLELRGTNVRVGASCYSPIMATAIHARHELSVVQLPGNALDQRLASSSAREGLRGVEIHLRSAFLQGLLLLPLDTAMDRVPRASTPLRTWTSWCDERMISPLRAALSAVKMMPGIRYCIVGVDRLTQLEEIIGAWNDSVALDVRSLSCTDESVIDPRRWS